MAQKKMGRPPVEKPLKDRIFVLLSDESKHKLECCKKAFSATTSDIVRQGIDKLYDSLDEK